MKKIAFLLSFVLFGYGQKSNLGVITYSFRSIPHDVDKLIELCTAAGVKQIELMGDPAELYAGKPKAPFEMFVRGQRVVLTEDQKAQMVAYNKDVAAWRSNVSMDQFKVLRKKFKAAGIRIYAFKPAAFGVNNTDEEVSYGMRAAKALGAQSVTLEMPTVAGQTLRLGKLAEKHNIKVGYHAHLQATDTLWDPAYAESKANTANLDAGHYIAAGGNNTSASLLAYIEKHHKRISSMHLKDRKNKENGQANVVWGSGDTPICDILKLSKKYKIPVSIELEYDIPGDSDAIKETKKCISFANNCLK